MKIHELKTKELYFRAIVDHGKRFEIRNNDRDFKVGDILHLREWTGTKYTGAEILAKVEYMTDFEQKPGFVVMSIYILEHFNPET